MPLSRRKPKSCLTCQRTIELDVRQLVPSHSPCRLWTLDTSSCSRDLDGRLKGVNGADSQLEPWPQSANQPLAPMGVPASIRGQ
jgi:hypothetical protein